ncbi:ATP-binding protein [Streptomyces sp. RFCAC02]|uniref:SCO6881 family protein n=1 Tax=Streptomyces sp. RFCAC02 TaxID=2499143 RepID=UPI0010203A94|nr:ATP-binding protein [Streptomyces sp. RFCAC02]
MVDTIGGAADAVGDAAAFAADPGKAIGEWMADSAGELAAAAADLAADAVDATTHVDLGAQWFIDNYQMLLPIGLVLIVATFCAQLTRAALRRDGQALAQAFTGTVTGVLFSFAAIALTTVALDVTDALSDGLFTASGQSVSDAVRRVVSVGQITGLTDLGWLVAVFAALAAALGAALFWCVMMVRKVGILVLVTLAVFAGAGGGWEVARRWRRGWIEATATLVVSKLLMTVIFVLGISAIGSSVAEGGIGALADVLAGTVIMALVLLCPYATFRFVHWASEGTSGEDIHRAGGSGAQVARQHASHVGRRAAALAASGVGGAAAASGTAPQGPDSPTGTFPRSPAATAHVSGEGAAVGMTKAAMPPDVDQGAGTLPGRNSGRRRPEVTPSSREPTGPRGSAPAPSPGAASRPQPAPGPSSPGPIGPAGPPPDGT